MAKGSDKLKVKMVEMVEILSSQQTVHFRPPGGAPGFALGPKNKKRLF